MKKLIIVILVLIIGGGIYFFKFGGHKRHESHTSSDQIRDTSNKILYYTCGMHPSVRVSSDEYAKGNTKCPICYMDLTPIYATQATPEAAAEIAEIEEIADIVSINPSELALAGIETFKVQVIPLYKQIRTVGTTAYDPGLRTGQEEYLQAIKTYNKVVESGFADAKERTKELVEASRIKLELLGLDDQSIKELAEKGKADQSLILPANEMWVYAQVYEYETLWPQVGDEVEITLEADPALKLKGQIRSIEPVIKEKTRTTTLKIIVANQNKVLKPNMYVDVWLKSELGPVLSIPKDAVLDTGKRRVIYASLGQGRFQLREVITGPLARGEFGDMSMDFYPLVSGAEAGEEIVLKGNFLIDSQSQLGAAASAYGGSLGEDEEAVSPVHQH